MTFWAIAWTPRRGAPYIDYTSVRRTRRDAWAASLDFPSATPTWMAEIKRRRRKGLIRAVKVTLQEAS